MTPIYIYALTWGGEIVYVGRTGHLKQRLNAHRSDGKVFDNHEVLFVVFSQKVAERREVRLIKKHRPPYNKIVASNGSHCSEIPLPNPISVRLGVVGERLAEFCKATTFKRPEVLNLAMSELFKAYPKDSALADAVLRHKLARAAQ